MNIWYTLLPVSAVLTAVFSLVFYYQSRLAREKLEEREKNLERRMYELAILKELGDRIGYSLNIQNIVDIITGSLHQFIEYSAVSYMLLQPEKIIFKVHLEKSVSRTYINDIKDRMLKSLSALLNKDFKKIQLEEILSGAILVEEVEEPVQSFFNIPLVIGEKVVGVLTVSHTSAGLYQEEETTILYKITQQASQAVTRLHEVIETEQRKLNAMVASITEGVVMTDTDYRVVVANPAARRIVGFENKDEVTIFDFIDHLGGSFDIRGKLEESVKLDKVLLTDDVVIHERYFQIFVAPVKGNFSTSGEQVLGGVVIFHDITHDKELEKMREDFTSMMVHELRSPISTIKLMTQSILEDKKSRDSKKVANYMRMMNNSSSNMLNLVNDLLDVAKLESGHFTVHPELSDITGIIQEKIEFYKTSADEKKITLRSQLAKDLPKQANIDATRIGQVLSNFISNALKFTHNGGAISVQGFVHQQGKDLSGETSALGISWFVQNDDQKLRSLPTSIMVAVTDNGEGISSTNIPQLFNKFVQIQSNKAHVAAQQGTGLGLVVAKGIIEAHNGIIGVASEEGRGSTFYFTISP